MDKVVYLDKKKLLIHNMAQVFIMYFFSVLIAMK
jgi:hypothetical protein